MRKRDRVQSYIWVQILFKVLSTQEAIFQLFHQTLLFYSIQPSRQLTSFCIIILLVGIKCKLHWWGCLKLGKYEQWNTTQKVQFKWSRNEDLFNSLKLFLEENKLDFLIHVVVLHLQGAYLLSQSLCVCCQSTSRRTLFWTSEKDLTPCCARRAFSSASCFIYSSLKCSLILISFSICLF